MRGDSWGSVYLSANFSSALYNRDQDTTLLLFYFYKYFTSGSPYRKCTRKSIRQYEAMSLLKKSKVLLPDYLKINLYSLKCCTHWISAFKKKAEPISQLEWTKRYLSGCCAHTYTVQYVRHIPLHIVFFLGRDSAYFRTVYTVESNRVFLSITVLKYII